MNGMMAPVSQGANGGLSEQDQYMVKMMQQGMESCVVKSIMAGGMGFALGGAFGLFMAPFKIGFKDMGKRSYSSAKNFMILGAAFSGTECAIEGLRAKNDMTNGILAGCVVGGGLAYKAGPQAAALGCGGFAAFSAAIEAYMRMPGEE
ncbi:Mitochondrial import inner membrane translocase subunit tim22 [Cyphellophora attinorum]|uniref:Mitochondrial import inner membrane translocase subunit TIM22 n=1 Tax=Cyphellophora attinorum TaxID=1664694 RepID=A0A0N0NI68_9EURO|nr:Mitochondrial import inner membrane translocase subunit tim22 [Phialophora attinorum]KPI35388.1 Mitochondrial import inner membrane translocase subunit tim22 [Phialophora attinorum]